MTAISSSVVLDCVAIGAISKLAAQPVLAAKSLYMGQFVSAVTASGFMSDPAFGSTGAVLGVAESDSAAVAGESSGDRGVNLICGLFWRPNFGTRPVTLTDIGKVCYAVDNYTVGNTSTDGPVAGLVCGLDATLGVLVFVHPEMNYLLSQATLTSNLASIVNGLGASLIGLEDAGAFTNAATVEAAIAEIYQELKSTLGEIDIPADSSWTKADGTALAQYSAANDGSCGTYGDGTKVVGIRWNNTVGATDTIARSFKVPTDMDLTVAPVVKVLCAKVGATLADATTFVVGAYAQTPAALYDAGANLGATTTAVTGDAISKTLQQPTATLTVFPGATSRITMTLNPTAAKLGTDDMIVCGVIVSYKRKPRTS
jgi:hypothetical protein